MKRTKLYNKQYDSYCTWNGTAYENDGKVSGAYFYGLEKAKNNGFEPVIASAEELIDEIFEEKTNVEFYIATYEALEEDEQPFKEVVAVFTEDWELKYGKLYYSCYAHLGQHSVCSESFLRENCRKASETEYKELFNELTQVGYNLNII